MATMLAGRLNYLTGEFAVEEVPIPEPGPGQVRIRVGAAGICLSDAHVIDGTLRPLPGPNRPEKVTLGHEVAGTIQTIGKGVPGSWLAGQRVLLQAGQACGRCAGCLRNSGVCGSPMTRGIDYDGGWAEYAIADIATVVTIPDELPFEQAAIIPDAVSTPWAAIMDSGEVRPTQTVGVWGVGGLGAHAVQLLRAIGAAPIIAIDPLPEARSRAIELGADHAVDPTAVDFSARVGLLTNGRGLDVAFDFAGVSGVPDQAQSVLGLRGRLVVVGLSGTPVTITNATAFSFLNQRVLGHYGSLPWHVEQIVDLVRRQRLDFSRSISDILPLAEAQQGVDRLLKKEDSLIRLVLRP
jgi:D-arabinose 1-dehydrogenase-like Zn-dependent alcohol dehydrogenase